MMSRPIVSPEWSLASSVKPMAGGSGRKQEAAPVSANKTPVAHETRPPEPPRPPRGDDVRPSRRHVQRNLHHLDRVVRHAIKDALHEARDAGTLDREAVKSYREASRSFGDDLQAVFHEAGRGSQFDHQAILEGVSKALAQLAETLRELNGPVDEARTPVAHPAEPVEPPVESLPTPVPEPEGLPALQNEPLVGGLVSARV
jgi:hypothetical protein